jgi:hypothetical protein
MGNKSGRKQTKLELERKKLLMSLCDDYPGIKDYIIARIFTKGETFGIENATCLICGDPKDGRT